MKKRLIFDQILAEKKSKKASIIIGPRQVGKTTILKELHKTLGGLFFDIDIFSDYSKISSYENAINTFKINGYKEKQKSIFYIFLDEFQRYAEITKTVKSLFDHHHNIKIFATGSSALGIKNSIQESLAGRKNITYVYPLDFTEFLYFKNRSDIADEISRLPKIKSDDYFVSLNKETYSLLSEFIVFGGYPEVVLAKNKEEKQKALSSIFDLYIKKDFAEYAKTEKLLSANKLMQLVAINNGQQTNHARYAEIAGIDVRTVKNYLTILEETFITVEIHPYFQNKNKEISKMSKIYFLDNGVRNFFSGGFADWKLRADAGFLFEGFYISELIKKGVDAERIKFYRTKSGEEIDIILDLQDKLVPIELKMKKKVGLRDISAVKRFVEKNSLKKGYVVTTGELVKKGKIETVDCFRKVYH